MKQSFIKFLAVGTVLLLAPLTMSLEASDMQARIRTATQILDQKQHSDEPIPPLLLNHAKGVAIFTVTKAGLGIGGQVGEGIVVLRLGDMNGNSWTAPSAFDLQGGSVGAQIGFTEARYIVVLNTDDAVRHFTGSGKLNWDATATGTAGADNATARASTTDLEHREVVVYKDSGGVFGGATLGGTSVERNKSVNHDAYGSDVRTKNILNGKVPPPASASRLYLLLGGNA